MYSDCFSFFPTKTKKINTGRWKGAWLAEVGHVSVLSLLVSWWWAVSTLDSCSHQGGGKACTQTHTHTHTHTHTCRRTSAGMSVPSLIPDDMPTTVSCSDASHHRLSLTHTHTHTYAQTQAEQPESGFAWEQRGQVIASAKWKKAAASVKGDTELSSLQLCCHTVGGGGLHCELDLVYSYFSYRNFTSADGWGEAQTCFFRWDVWRRRCLGSLRECVEGMWRGGEEGVSKIFVLLRCLRWTLSSAMPPGMCPACPPIH